MSKNDNVNEVNSLLGNTKIPQTREWQLTLNNWTQFEYDKIKSYVVNKKYWMIGKEIGKVCGTPHIHIYIKHKTGIRWETLKNLNDRFHIVKCKGDLAHNHKYCSKQGDFITNITQEDVDKCKQKRKMKKKNLTLAQKVHEVMCRKYKQALCADCQKIMDECRKMNSEKFKTTRKPWKEESDDEYEEEETKSDEE